MNETHAQRWGRRRFLRLLGVGAVGTSLGGFATAEYAPGDVRALERHKALERAFVGHINARDVDGAMSLLDPEFVNYDVPGREANLEDTRAFFTALVAGFPDGRYTILDMVAEGDKVVRFMRGEGTHTGAFMGIPATGRRVSYLFIDIDRIVGGKIREHWGVSDTLGMMQQLGLMLVPGGRETR